MTPNPKITQERVQYPEDQDYPRWTGSMLSVLNGIRKFRNELERVRP